MGIVSLPSYGSDPATVNASNLDGKVDPLATEFNGGIDNDNIDAAAAIAASKLNLATMAQSIAMSSKQFLWAKGADVASGTSIALGTDGNCFDITGTTTINTITAKQAGSVVLLHFDSALTLTDDTGNLELQGANLAVAAESEVILKSDGTDWHLVSYSNGRSPLTTQGDVPYHNGTLETRLAAGTSGQFLKTLGAGANPAWADVLANAEGISIATRDITAASGNVTLTFSKIPLALIAIIVSSTNNLVSIGFYTASGAGSVHSDSSTNQWVLDATNFISCLTGAAGQTATISGALGLSTTLAWTLVGSPGAANLTGRIFSVGIR